MGLGLQVTLLRQSIHTLIDAHNEICFPRNGEKCPWSHLYPNLSCKLCTNKEHDGRMAAELRPDSYGRTRIITAECLQHSQ